MVSIMRSCEIELGNLIEIIDHGEVISNFVWRPLFGNKKSIRQTEFYSAANVGLKPELVFEVFSFEYLNDEKLRYNSKEFFIIRTYEKGDKIELTISATVGTTV